MTVRSLLGLAALNLFALGVGAGMLWGLRGWRSWWELGRLAGLAYMLGIAGLGVALGLALVVGIPFSFATIVLTGLALAAAGIGIGLRLGRPRPVLGPGPRRIGLAGAALAALVIVYLEALFRAARLSGLYAFDAWSFWVPKAKAIYFFGGIDEQFFSELPNATYPPLVPTLEATAFHFMGSADAVTLHVQFWFLLAGFVAAVAGLLATRVPPVLLWAFALLALVSPRVVGRTLEPQADFTLDCLFGLAALLVGLWLLERQPWQLASATLFLGATMLTKREGQLLAACVIAAAAMASWREWRSAWPRLVLASACAIALALPWRVWYVSHDLTGEFPESGATGLLDNLDRAWPSLQSVLTSAFDSGLWTVVLPLVIAAIVLAFIAGARTLPLYAAFVYGLALAGFTWAIWSFTELEVPIEQDEAINPVVRLTASLVVLSIGLAPLLLDAAWRGTDRPVRSERR
ncbi:MAG: hypothetical protein M3364_01765 [Actinomycetota bacterium]|nr:hypothetical protein [Actinomycetota bacterium]